MESLLLQKPFVFTAITSKTMVLTFVILAILVGVAVSSYPMHPYHSRGSHDGHHDYHHGHHGYHGRYYAHQGLHSSHYGHHGHDYYDNHQDYHGDNVSYKFKYDVKDPKTYNYQSREEYKDGKNVYGSYSLVEPDGKVHIVKYKADDYGFQADGDYKGGYKNEYKGGYKNEYKGGYKNEYKGGYEHDYKPSYGHHDSHYRR